MDADEQLVPCFVPALVAILLNRERAKGSPLTEAEVLRERDEATAMMVPASVARDMSASRGYDDLDPEHVWEQWQRMRLELD